MHIILIFCLSSLKIKIKTIQIKKQQNWPPSKLLYIYEQNQNFKQQPENIYYYSYITLIIKCNYKTIKNYNKKNQKKN